MDFVAYTLVQWKFFVLILIRIGGIVSTAPFFGSPLFPNSARIAFILVLTLVLFPILPQDAGRLPETMGEYLLVVFLEASIGIIVGLAATLVFAGVQLGGQVMDMQIGFALANVIDPITQTQQSILSQFWFLFATLIFLASRGHHMLLHGMVDSFHAIPLGGLTLDRSWVDLVSLKMAGEMFVVAVRISAPIVVSLLLATVAMGFMARTVPEMNIFILGFALRIVVGLGIMVVVLPLIAHAMIGLFDVLAVDLANLLVLLGGGAPA